MLTRVRARTVLVFCVCALLAAVAPAFPQTAPLTSAPSAAEKDAIVAVVQKLFDAMTAKDPAAALTVLVPEGRFFVPREGAPPRTFTGQEFADSLAKQKATVRERFWDPEVRVRGSIATIWTPYDFWTDGKFSHCGIDAFDLIKTDQGWKISGGTYTVERTGCPPSPLGPLKP